MYITMINTLFGITVTCSIFIKMYYWKFFLYDNISHIAEEHSINNVTLFWVMFDLQFHVVCIEIYQFTMQQNTNSFKQAS